MRQGLEGRTSPCSWLYNRHEALRVDSFNRPGTIAYNFLPKSFINAAQKLSELVKEAG